ncbi:DUF4921 family protein [Corynebacterium sp. TAE3-ERU2]|uniref:DUF4921 family protein n=1 Tax=Corynebacterium sp. TAE3-ERU2 TaxID=2849497 RepID=UPI001C447116|nr:DUF4921 family protein [Corynebacterium sp. TAE3-ERU2]MBV7301759.1 DUF4921 family protein [Corynebacterium sp. TAE3-ERU2]
MSSPMYSRPAPLQTMADGTIKQINPFSGTEVWTVPGRGNRPLAVPKVETAPLRDEDRDTSCAFGAARLLETPPEKSRIVRTDLGWEIKRGLLPSELDENYAFRRVPNLFEILSFDYWQANYDLTIDEEISQRMHTYIADPAGREHVLNIVRTRMRASGIPEAQVMATTEEDLLAKAPGYFAGGHDVIIGRRHFRDDATDTSGLASSGTLSVDEHRAFIRFTVDSMQDLYRHNRYAPYVAVFQNWLKPAGASFDHLHKQLVAIDDRGVQAEGEISRLRANPNMYNEWAVDYAHRHNLVIGENDHAVCFAGFGHRYPTLEIFSKSARSEPWNHTDDERDAMSDLIHACHAATGAEVPCNEEWHHKPINLDLPMPWRVMIKWRVSTLAGFEGGTKIYLNTMSPYTVRDRVVSRLYELREQKKVASNLRIATEVELRPNPLRYTPSLP